MSARLVLDGIACARGGRLVFEGVDLTLEAGGAALVTGPNGAGKSSLIRIAAGLLAPPAGMVTRAGDVALLAEGTALDPERTLREALDFWARIDGAADRVAAALDAVALGGLGDVPVCLLSTGQRRRAAFARVIVSGAPIWLLDEPANGLDDVSVALLEARIADHRAGGGIALVATHLPLAMPLAVEVRL